jgi:membrane protein YdbS with pleckstrin-like domain
MHVEGMMGELAGATRIGRLRCNFGTVDAIGGAILWIVLTIVTLGIALVFFPYFLNRAVLNKTEVLNAQGQPVGRLNCQFGVGSSIGHVIIWLLLIIVTLGLASILYAYRVLRVVLNETYIEYY